MITLCFILENNFSTIQECLDSLNSLEEYISEYYIKSSFSEDVETLEIIDNWGKSLNINKCESLTDSQVIIYMYGNEKLNNLNDISSLNIDKKYNIWVSYGDYLEKQNRINGLLESNVTDTLNICFEKIFDDPVETERRAVNLSIRNLDKRESSYLDVVYYYRLVNKVEMAKKSLMKEPDNNRKSIRYLVECYLNEPTYENISTLLKYYPKYLYSYYVSLDYYYFKEEYEICYLLLIKALNVYDMYDNSNFLVKDLKEKVNIIALNILNKLDKSNEIRTILFKMVELQNIDFSTTIENINKKLVFLDIEPNDHSIDEYLKKDENIIYIGISRDNNLEEYKKKISNRKHLIISGVSIENLKNTLQLFETIGLNKTNFYIIKCVKNKEYIENNEYIQSFLIEEREKKNSEAFVINLSNRKDRLKNVKKAFSNKLNLIRVEAVKETPGWVGCFKSHQRCLRIAKNKKMDSILVIEDDCELFREKDFLNEWEKIKLWLDTHLNEWDVFLGGCTNLREDCVLENINNDLGLVRLSFSTPAHFVYYNKSIYDKIIDCKVEQKTYKPVDIAICEFAKDRIVTKVPFLAKQKEYYSDIECKIVNYDSLFAESERIILNKLNGKFIENKKIISPVLMGGLGNRMFQIAAAYGISKKQDKELIITNDFTNIHSKQDYFTNIFKNIKKSNRNINAIFQEPEDKCYSYMDIPNVNEDLRLLGYFQNEKYFVDYRDDILDTFRMENSRRTIIESLYPDAENRYFIHIRRGDYVSHPIHDVGLERNYYRKALEYIKTVDSNRKYYCFSDNTEYCKTLEWLKDEDVIYIEKLDEVNSLYLMSMCKKGGIGANSSYSWWGGWLNENRNKITIYPNKWLNKEWGTNISLTNVVIIDI